MATQFHVENEVKSYPVPDGNSLSVGIAVAEWNGHITGALLKGAIDTLKKHHVAKIRIMNVPGTFELTNAAARLSHDPMIDGVIVIGCVVRGDTPHFDYICQGVTQGIAYLNAQKAEVSAKMTHKPIIFGVLTTNTMEQAEERAGGALGNKGAEAAETLLKMCRPHIETIENK